VELVRSALLASLEALPPYTLFGLATFSHQVRVVAKETASLASACVFFFYCLRYI
jgi:hypothetical protein